VLAIGMIAMFASAPAAIASSPTITESAVDWTSITPTTATVAAEINPNGEGTAYHVEYVSQAQFKYSGYAGASTAPAGIAGVGDGEVPQAVEVALTGLQPATIYRLRFVAVNVSGTVIGPELIFGSFAVEPNFAGSCPTNEGFRTGFGADLPDCRAYEQASPVDKHGANIQHSADAGQASPSGDAITFGDANGLPTTGGTSRPTSYLARRGGSGWFINGLRPRIEPTLGYSAEMLGLSPDFAATLSTTEDSTGGHLVLGDTVAGTWEEIADASSANAYESKLAGFAAEDDQHALFESLAVFAPGAVLNQNNLYDVDQGVVTNAARVPVFPATSCDDGGAPACIDAPQGGFAGPYQWGAPGDLTEGGARARYYLNNVISADGSKIFFTEAGTGRLYMRTNNTATTQISASQASTPDPNGDKPAAFIAATEDGSRVFFLSCEKLTDDSTAVSTADNTCVTSSQGQDLYEYDTVSGELIDLTVDSNVSDPLGAEVIGVLGQSKDASDVYFVANGVLAAGASSGNCERLNYFNGECNVYLSHNGVITFVARVESGAAHHSIIDYQNWLGFRSNGLRSLRTSRVSANGTLIISAATKLTSYDNHGRIQIYRYQPGDTTLACISCDPTLAPPLGSGDASLVSYGELAEINPGSKILQRNISPDGNRVIFQSPDPLVPADVNGDAGCPDVAEEPVCLDVYEWEANGTGSCHSSDANGGCIYLLSSGISPNASYYGDSSMSGDDVFIFTTSPLVPQDEDELVDAYDVRVGGGLAAQHPAPPVPPCEGEACREAGTAAPTTAGAGTAVFQGPGNPAAKHGQPKKRHRHRRKHRGKRHHSARSHRAAARAQGGSK
jgi:hypothetical protein